jgi:hypothetical protein
VVLQLPTACLAIYNGGVALVYVSLQGMFDISSQEHDIAIESEIQSSSALNTPDWLRWRPISILVGRRTYRLKEARSGSRSPDTPVTDKNPI